jgi:hypothetical protein
MQEILQDKTLMDKFVLKLGLDPERVAYKWNASSKEYLETQNPTHGPLLSTLQTSTGLIQEKLKSSVDVPAEYKKWVTEWGIEEADILLKQVEDAMKDYEYLRSVRLR